MTDSILDLYDIQEIDCPQERLEFKETVEVLDEIAKELPNKQRAVFFLMMRGLKTPDIVRMVAKASNIELQTPITQDPLYTKITVYIGNLRSKKKRFLKRINQ